MRRCCEQRWPGNVRQLKNVMERLTALHPGGVLEPEDLGRGRPAGARHVSSLSALPWKDAREQYLASFEVPMRRPCWRDAAEM